MLKLMDKKIITILHSERLLILTYVWTECVIKNSFSHFSTKTYVVGTQNSLIETVLLRTQNVC